MEKLKFIMKRLKNLNFTNMMNTAKKIAKKTNKFFLVVLLDIIYCGFKYEAGYNDYLEFQFYLLNKKQRKTYLTAGKNNRIIKKYNNKDFWHLFDNKIQFNILFKEYLNREWMDLTNSTVEEFKEFVQKHDTIIVKPIDDCGGNGVEKIEIKQETDIAALYDKLKENGQMLVEEFIYQHHELSKMYPGSVNTIRIFTIYKEEANYLQGVLKLGNGGNVDNFSSGGMYTFVDEHGVVIAPAIDKEDRVYFEHPITKAKIVGFKVPKYEEAKKLVCDAAKEIPEVGYIGWDVAITEERPVIIEGNCYPGVFQLKPEFSKEKEGILKKYNNYIQI